MILTILIGNAIVGVWQVCMHLCVAFKIGTNRGRERERERENLLTCFLLLQVHQAIVLPFSGRVFLLFFYFVIFRSGTLSLPLKLSRSTNQKWLKSFERVAMDLSQSKRRNLSRETLWRFPVSKALTRPPLIPAKLCAFALFCRYFVLLGEIFAEATQISAFFSRHHQHAFWNP